MAQWSSKYCVKETFHQELYRHCRKKHLVTEMVNTRNWTLLFPLPYTTPFQLITSKLHSFTIFLYSYIISESKHRNRIQKESCHNDRYTPRYMQCYDIFLPRRDIQSFSVMSVCLFRFQTEIFYLTTLSLAPTIQVCGTWIKYEYWIFMFAQCITSTKNSIYCSNWCTLLYKS